MKDTHECLECGNTFNGKETGYVCQDCGAEGSSIEKLKQ